MADKIHLGLDKLLKEFEIKNPLSMVCQFSLMKEKIYEGIIDRISSFLAFAETTFPICHSTGKSNELSSEFRAEGNRYYVQSKDHDMALKVYNLAIAYAENSSAEICMAYANRSAINFESGRFEDAIVDIERALQRNYPERLKFKILHRKSKCFAELQNYTHAISSYKEALESLVFLSVTDAKKSELKCVIEREIAKIKNKKDVSKKDDEKEKKLSDSPSKIIYCSSDAVKIDFSPSVGRFAVATKNIELGDVLAIEDAYAAVLGEDHLLNFCYHCKKRSYSMIPCSRCTQVFYCNENCRSKSWDTDHMIECDIIPTIIKLNLGIALKVLLKMTKQGRKLQKFFDNEEKYRESNDPFSGFKNEKYSANKTAMVNLHFNESLFHSEDSAIFVLHACIIVSALKTTDFFNYVENKTDMYLQVGRMLTIIICQAASNLFNLGGDNNFGCAILPFMSLLGHSCDPNCLATSIEKETFILVAIEKILKGQQISISYGPDFYMSNEEREKIFRLRGFKCCCYACERNWPPVHLMPNPGLLNQRVSTKLFNEQLMEFLEIYNYFLHEIQDKKDAKVQQSDFKTAIRVAVYLNKSLKKPSQILYDCKRLIISMIYNLIDNNSFKFK